ncbi:MAG: hypothetical protein IPM92_01690 [Saprospiraceae bacterium]|nr:hypothetical protein [Saprospiraceae bacterium]
MSHQVNKPFDHPRIFWDLDSENLDFEKYAFFIIERVFSRGDVQDIRNCRRYYEPEKITAALLQAKYLPLMTLYLASAVINKPIQEFRCYTLRQSNPELFPY